MKCSINKTETKFQCAGLHTLSLWMIQKIINLHFYKIISRSIASFFLKHVFGYFIFFLNVFNVGKNALKDKYAYLSDNEKSNFYSYIKLY